MEKIERESERKWEEREWEWGAGEGDVLLLLQFLPKLRVMSVSSGENGIGCVLEIRDQRSKRERKSSKVLMETNQYQLK